MRALLIGDFPPPFGGIAVHVRQLFQAYVERGLDVRVIDIGKGGHGVAGVTPARTMPSFARALLTAATERRVLHLHTSGNNPKSWIVAGAVAATPAPAKVLTVHSGLAPGFLAASPAHRALAWTALAGFDRIVAVSEAVRIALLELGVPPGKLLVLPAFCASQVRAGEPPSGFAGARARRAPLLAMAHHPSPVYGRALAFEALALLASRAPRAGLALFGPGANEATVRDDARRFGVEDRLELFGELDHPAALGLIQASDVFLRPTTADGDAISVREALALGVRCVASDVAARPEGTTVFRAGDATDLVSKVEAALAAERAGGFAPDAAPVLMELYRSLVDDARAGTAATAA